MSKIDNLINKFFDRLRRGIVNKFGKDLLRDPKVQQSIKTAITPRLRASTAIPGVVYVTYNSQRL